MGIETCSSLLGLPNLPRDEELIKSRYQEVMASNTLLLCFYWLVRIPVRAYTTEQVLLQSMVLCRSRPSLFWPCATFLSILYKGLVSLMFGLTSLLVLAITAITLLVVSCTGETRFPQPCLQKKKKSEGEVSFDVCNIESAVDGFAGNGNFTPTAAAPVEEAAIPHVETNSKFSIRRAVRESLRTGIPGAFGGFVQVTRLWNVFCIQCHMVAVIVFCL